MTLLSFLLLMCSHRAGFQAKVFLKDGTSNAIHIHQFKHQLISPNEELNMGEIDSLVVNGLSSYSITFIPLKVTVYEEEQLVLAKKISHSVYETVVNYRRCTCNDSYSNTRAIIYKTESKNHVFLKQLIGNRVLKHQLNFNQVPQNFRDFFKLNKMKYSEVKKGLDGFEF